MVLARLKRIINSTDEYISLLTDDITSSNDNETTLTEVINNQQAQIQGKADFDIVVLSVNNNLPDENGNVTISGGGGVSYATELPMSDTDATFVYDRITTLETTTEDLQIQIDSIDLSNYYTNTQVDTLLLTKVDTSTLDNYSTTEEMNTQLDLKANQTDLDDLEALVDTKANVGDSYLKTESYSDTEIDTLVEDKSTVSVLNLRLDTSKDQTAIPSSASPIVWDNVIKNTGGLFDVTNLEEIVVLRDCFCMLYMAFGIKNTSTTGNTHVRIETVVEETPINYGYRYFDWQHGEYNYRDIVIPMIEFKANDRFHMILYAGSTNLVWNNYPTSYPANLVLTEVKLKDI